MSKGAVFDGDFVYRSIIMSVSERQAALIARSRHVAQMVDLGVVARFRARFSLRGAQKRGHGIRIRGKSPIIHVWGQLEIGGLVLFDAPVTPIYLSVEPGAILSIGNEAYLNDAVWVTATDSITIGNRVRIGPGVRIMDNSFHGVNDRRRPPSRPVQIDDDVWIASDVLIGPGVHIGRGAVVGAHSVVTKDVPEYTVVAGSPARHVKAVDRLLLEASLS